MDRDAHAGGQTADDAAIWALESAMTVLLRRARIVANDLARDLHPDLESDAYALLSLISQYDSVRSTELTEQYGVGKATLSRQLALLERLGLVDRRPDETDRRASSLALSAEGRRRLDATRGARRSSYRELMASWQARDVAELARLLDRLNDTLGPRRV